MVQRGAKNAARAESLVIAEHLKAVHFTPGSTKASSTTLQVRLLLAHDFDCSFEKTTCPGFLARVSRRLARLRWVLLLRTAE